MQTKKTINSTCPYCGVGCGIKVEQDKELKWAVNGDKEHPANFGRLCSKGSSLAATLDDSSRLLKPSVNGKDTDWDSALGHVANQLNRIRKTHGPDSIAFYLSGQLLTEDYYAANKLMKGFIGSANVDTNSRLCMSSAVVGHKRAFGVDAVPGCYDDLEQADLLVIVGSNMAWCHPVVYQRIIKAKSEHPHKKMIVIDPRRTATCDTADLHLPIKPGKDILLFNALLTYLSVNNGLDKSYIKANTEGFDIALEMAREHGDDWQSIADKCGLELADMMQFFALFKANEKTVTVFSQGVNQSTVGSDKANSIINVHLATGRIGKVGACPFSITGQPNAMGGREVGGLSNQLAAHMDFAHDDVDKVKRFWQASNMATEPGLKAVDMFAAIKKGDVKAVWIVATNPVVSMPQADEVKAALDACELVIVSDCIAKTDTTVHADVLLPAQGWSEKDGTVTNSERRISRQQRFRDAQGDAKPDWWIVSEVGKRMGFTKAFDYQDASDIFREHAELSSFENNGSRDFDLQALTDITEHEYNQLEPIQWPVNAEHPDGAARLFEDGRFFTPSGKAKFIATKHKDPRNPPSSEYPLILNTGRIRDQWHTMTRTGIAEKLQLHITEPYIDMHPDDAVANGLTEGDIGKITSRWGNAQGRVQITDRQQPGQVFMPIHWNDQFAKQARVGAVVNPETDPFSGQPEFKHTPVAIRVQSYQWYGFALSKSSLSLPEADYQVRIKGQSHWRYELAGSAPEDWHQWQQAQLRDGQAWSFYEDKHAGLFRAAVFEGDQLKSCFFVSPTPDLPARSWLAQVFQHESIDDEQRRALLAGRPADEASDTGAMVCSCFGVGEKTITRAIKQFDLKSVAHIGDKLQAGTNCGSCIPELKMLINKVT